MARRQCNVQQLMFAYSRTLVWTLIRDCNDKGGREVSNKKSLALSWHLAVYDTSSARTCTGTTAPAATPSQ